MAESHKLQKDPPEGSRQTIEHELQRQSGQEQAGQEQAGQEKRSGSGAGLRDATDKAKAKPAAMTGDR